MIISCAAKEKIANYKARSSKVHTCLFIIAATLLVGPILISQHVSESSIILGMYAGLGVAIISIIASVLLHVKNSIELMKIDDKLEQINKKLDEFSK